MLKIVYFEAKIASWYFIDNFVKPRSILMVSGIH